MNNLSGLITELNIKILLAIDKKPDSLRGIAQRVGCSAGKVHQASKTFQKFEIITTKKEKNSIILSSNKKNPVFFKLKALINTQKILESQAYDSLSKIALLGVYGSYAQGKNDEKSDVDLLIVTDKKEINMQDKIREFERELDKTVNPFIITRKNLDKLEEEDKEFYIRLKLTTTELNGEIFG